MAEELGKYIVLLWPVIVLQLFLQIYALVDLLKRSQARQTSPLLWGLIIVLGGLLGSIAYLLFRGHGE